MHRPLTVLVLLMSCCITALSLRRPSVVTVRSQCTFSTSTSNRPRMPTKLLASKKTGAFKTMPETFPSQTHYRRALRSLKQVKPDPNVKNIRNQNRKLTAVTMDALMKSLTMPITEVLNSFSTTFKTLHPFEATVADLTVTARQKAGHQTLETILGNLKTLRANTSRIAKDYASRGNNAESAQEAKQLLEDGMKELEQLFETSPEAGSFAELVELQKDLRRIPVVELETPTIVLVGAPNVGKSSIVRVVSSGTPEVNDYPFTTRGVSIGHISDGGPTHDLRFQVMDTPGLLDRPADERNEMERLTFASLAHLPTAVLYVIDPTGLSGEKSTIEAQLNVRKMLKERFPKRPWLDVISKGDLMDQVPEHIREQLPEGYLPISVKAGNNIEILKQEIDNMLVDLGDMLRLRQQQQAHQEAAAALAAAGTTGAGAGAGVKGAAAVTQHNNQS